MMAMPVPVVPVVKKTLPIYLDYPGRIESIRSIALQARVSGYIEAQPAADGADVKSGDLLYQIDPRDLQAALDQANAQAQRDQASLEYAKANLGRGEELVKSGFVAKDAYDQRASSMHQVEAQLVLDQRRDRGREAQSRLYGDPRAFRRPARAQPGRERRAGRSGERGAQHAGRARPDLRHLQPERDRIWSRSRRRGPQARSTPRFRSRAPRRSARAH